ncbi:MAG TPA: alkaline phosphatase [Gaiellaceae bacterium]
MPAGPEVGRRPGLDRRAGHRTKKAIQLLDRNDWRSKKRKKGFFLQVESASIDKRDHSSEPCEQIGETVQLDQTVKVALDYAKREGDTLVIVNADHSHTSQIVEVDASPPGFSSILTTDEGENMMVTYGTTAGLTAPSVSQEHTGATVPIAAYGPQAANVVGLIDQTEIFRIIARAIDD